MAKRLKVKHNYVYMLQEREFIKTCEPIYKIGKTTQEPNSRLRGYPNKSQVILFVDVPDCHTTEKHLITAFKKSFKQRKDIGTEYFEGELNQMKRTFFHVINSEFQGKYIHPGSTYNERLREGLWDWTVGWFV